MSTPTDPKPYYLYNFKNFTDIKLNFYSIGTSISDAQERALKINPSKVLSLKHYHVRIENDLKPIPEDELKKVFDPYGNCIDIAWIRPAPLRASNEIEERIIEEIRIRRDKGRAKYGTSMERTDLARKEWLQHAKEEALDLAIYLEKMIKMEEAIEADEKLIKEKKKEETVFEHTATIKFQRYRQYSNKDKPPTFAGYAYLPLLILWDNIECCWCICVDSPVPDSKP